MMKDSELFSFENYNAGMLDVLFRLRYGERELSSSMKDILHIHRLEDITTEKLDLLADVMYSSFSERWKVQKDFYLDNDVVLGDYNIVESETVVDVGEDTSTNETVSTDEDVEMVSGFNSPMFVENSSSVVGGNTSQDSSNTRNNSRTRDYTRSGNVTENISRVDKYLQIKATNVVIDIILKNVADEISLLIY